MFLAGPSWLEHIAIWEGSYFKGGDRRGATQGSWHPNLHRLCRWIQPEFAQRRSGVKPHQTNPNMSRGLNIIIPMGGLGSRFSEHGYRFPKPLINIVGRPMLIWLLDNLNISEEDTLFVAMQDEVAEDFHVVQLLKKKYPHICIKYVPLFFVTRGAAETLYAVTKSMSSAELARATISLDCDTFYFSDILLMFRSLPHGQGASFYFKDIQSVPRFSYIRQNEDGRVVEVKEKKRISNDANTGAYGFATARDLLLALEEVLMKPVPRIGEYYTSSVMQHMIEKGHHFSALLVGDFSCVGTTDQLNQFLQTLQRRPEINPQRRFCFDLDNTLVSHPIVPGDYSTVKPIQSNINIARKLKKMGHTIIIYTARRMRTHSGNIGKIMQDVGQVTFANIADFDIPCDELYFGKPYADVYIDDLAVHSLLDTERELGLDITEKNNHIEGAILPRPHNNVVQVNNMVIKSSPDVGILGEKYMYENIPEEIRDLFPVMMSSSTDPSQQIHILNLERIDGYPLSRVFASRCLNVGHLESILTSLRRMHTSVPLTETNDGSEMMYLNYGKKLEFRVKANEELYRTVGLPTETKAQLFEELELYESESRGVYSAFIHGDPVLTNILSVKGQCRLKFIDMRGRLGDAIHAGGDINYDLGKVLQSLLGYDFILLEKVFEEPDVVYLKSMQEQFFKLVQQYYPTSRQDDLYLIASSLFVSLVPYHSDALKQRRYMALGMEAFERFRCLRYGGSKKQF